MGTKTITKPIWPSSATEHYQWLIRQYKDAGQPWPASMRAISKWAIDSGTYSPKFDRYTSLAQKLSNAARLDMTTDPQGRKVRKLHAIPESQIEDENVIAAIDEPSASGRPRYFWKELEEVTPPEMHASLSLRRSHAKGECRQIKTDMDSFNDNRIGDCEPIDMSFNFDVDFEEDSMPATFEDEFPG